MSRVSLLVLLVPLILGFSDEDKPTAKKSTERPKQPAVSYRFAPPVRLEAAGKPIDTEVGHAAPLVVDFDGDGLPDLIVGCGDGSVIFYKNIGTAREPKLAEGQVLIPAAKIEYDPEKIPTQPTRGVRAKVCVVDYNGDGLPDLLVGDLSNQKPDRPEPTAEEKQKQEAAKKELEKLQTEYRSQIDKLFGPKRVKDKDEAKKVSEALSKLAQRMTELRKDAGTEYETHGWVWLYLREPVKKTAE